MKTKLGSEKRLVEALVTDLNAKPAWTNGRFFQKCLQEAKLLGNVTDDGTADVATTNEILNQILMGLEGHETLEFVKQYTTDKATFSIPIGTYGTATTMSGGSFTNSPKTTENVDVDIDEEVGIESTWTRSHLEDATWDVLSEQNQGAGYSIKSGLITKCVDLIAALTTTLAGGGIVDLSTEITWAQFRALCKSIDVAKTGPATHAVCSPGLYWDLLGLDQFVNSLYAGSDEVMRTGIAKTTFGMTVIRCSELEADAIFVLNQKKAVGLVTRRNITVEPFEHPDDNEYGFVASTRAKATILVPSAIAVGEITI